MKCNSAESNQSNCIVDRIFGILIFHGHFNLPSSELEFIRKRTRYDNINERQILH